jgi:hypothetical protein
MEHRRFLTTTILATTIIFLFTAPELRAQGHTKGRPVGASAADSNPEITCGIRRSRPPDRWSLW